MNNKKQRPSAKTTKHDQSSVIRQMQSSSEIEKKLKELHGDSTIDVMIKFLKRAGVIESSNDNEIFKDVVSSYLLGEAIKSSPISFSIMRNSEVMLALETMFDIWPAKANEVLDCDKVSIIHAKDKLGLFPTFSIFIWYESVCEKEFKVMIKEMFDFKLDLDDRKKYIKNNLKARMKEARTY